MTLKGTSQKLLHFLVLFILVTIIKSGDHSAQLNNGSIILTGPFYKHLEHMIHSQVINYLEDQKVILK